MGANSNPIERAIAAIADVRGTELDKFIIRSEREKIVRAVLRAIREPSEAMVGTFIDNALHGDVLSHGGWPGYARDQWQAMIDAALAELPQTETNPIGEA